MRRLDDGRTAPGAGIPRSICSTSPASTCASEAPRALSASSGWSADLAWLAASTTAAVQPPVAARSRSASASDTARPKP